MLYIVQSMDTLSGSPRILLALELIARVILSFSPLSLRISISMSRSKSSNASSISVSVVTTLYIPFTFSTDNTLAMRPIGKVSQQLHTTQPPTCGIHSSGVLSRKYKILSASTLTI